MGVNEYVKIGERIKEMRKAKGIKQKDMAKKLNINVSTYANYENGYREPSLDILFNISDIFNVSVDELIGLELPEVSPEKLEEEAEWYESHKELFNETILLENLSEEESERWEKSYQTLNNSLLLLNLEGKEEAAKRVEELTHIKKYSNKRKLQLD